MKLFGNLFFFFVCFAFLLINCTHEPKVSTDNNDKAAKKNFVEDARNIGPAKSDAQVAIEEAHQKIEEEEKRMIGYWVGQFGHDKISIVLSEISNGTAVGHSICAGKYRRIEGTEQAIAAHKFSYTMNESGNKANDGSFEFTIDLNENTLSGTWSPYSNKNNIPKSFILKKINIEYKATEGSYPQASTRRLEESDVINLDAHALKIMRNEIYARYGYAFKNKEIRNHFELLDWYKPISIDVRDQLSDIEVDNIALIYDFETYYEEYYDVFGR